MTKREFLAAGIGAGLTPNSGSAALSQGARKLPVRKAKTTKLFKSPQGFPTAISVTSEGLWIGEQKMSGDQAKTYKLPAPKSLEECAWLVDWSGRLLRTVTTPSRNTSGMAVGGVLDREHPPSRPRDARCLPPCVERPESGGPQRSWRAPAPRLEHRSRERTRQRFSSVAAWWGGR